MHKYQMLFLLCLGYIGGVFIGSFFLSSQWILFCLIALWIGICIAFPFRILFLLIFPLCTFILGGVYTQQSFQKFQNDPSSPITITGTVRVVGEPEEKSFFRQTIVRVVRCESGMCLKEKILWQAPLIKDIHPGSKLVFSCTLERPKNFDEQFDYRMFLAKEGIGYICPKATTFQILPEDWYARMMSFFFFPKKIFEHTIERYIPQPEAGLALGLVVGGNDRLPENIRQAFITAGLSHITAISGYNIALIVEGLVFVGIGIGLWRRQALWFAMLGIVCFIILIGAPASAVRAGVMGVCVLGGLFFGRLSQGFFLLFFAGSLMLLFEPLLLRFDVGFQLSFLATLSLILFTPYIKYIVSRISFGKIWIEIALLTLGVELLVTPIIAYQFHIFSPFGLLMNVLILPLVPFAMVTTFFSGLGLMIFPFLSFLFVSVAYIPLWIILRSVEFLNEIGMTIVYNVTLTPEMLFLWYSGVFFGIVKASKYFSNRYVQEKNL